eukprot:COSAG02_NODE_1354_length_13100_cov_7.477040_7_plen_91_part_00
MSQKEMRNLAPGGVGGRGSASRREDQAAENGWRNIAVLEGFLDDTPRERRRRQRLETAPPATEAKPAPTKVAILFDRLKFIEKIRVTQKF